MSSCAKRHEILEKEISIKSKKLDDLKEKHLLLSSKVLPLKKTKQILEEEILMLQKKFHSEKENVDKLSQKVANLEWEKIKIEISSECEKVNIDIHLETISKIKDSQGTASKKRCEFENMESEFPSEEFLLTEKNKMAELEALKAQQEIKIQQQEEKYLEAESRNAIRLKRNAATLLRLRKSLQESENLRKTLLENGTNNH